MTWNGEFQRKRALDRTLRRHRCDSEVALAHTTSSDLEKHLAVPRALVNAASLQRRSRYNIHYYARSRPTLARPKVNSLDLAHLLYLKLALIYQPWRLPFSRFSRTIDEAVDASDDIGIESIRCRKCRPSAKSVRQSRVYVYSCGNTSRYDVVSTVPVPHD